MNTVMGKRRLAEQSGPAFTRSSEHPASLAEYILNLVEVNRDGEFVAIDRHGRRQSAMYADMLRRAHDIAEHLRGSSGDASAAVLCFEDVLEHIASAWACLLLGIDVLPLDSAAALADPSGFAGRLASIVQNVGGNPAVLTDHRIGKAANIAGGIDVSEIRPAPLAAEFDRSPIASKASNLLVSTSGTAGPSKVAVLDNASLTNRFFDGVRADRRACLYNLAHHSVAGVRLLLPIGRRVVYLHPLRLAAEPRDWFRVIEEFSVTDAGMSTSMASLLCRGASGSEPPCSMASLERISFGAEVIVPNVIRQFLHILRAGGAGEVRVSLVYSMTETGPIYRSTLPMSELLKQLETGLDTPALDSCVPGWSVRCVDRVGRVVAEGEPGVVQVRSDRKLFAGYCSEAGEKLSARSADGWFDTGDIGVLSGGRLTLKGRQKSTIIVNARKITCEEIEAHLAQCGALAATSIVVAPYRERHHVTDEVAVFFASEKGGDAHHRDVVSSIVSTVAKYFRISVSHVVAVAHSDIERTATMKVKRDALVQKYKAGDFTNHLNGRSNERKTTNERAYLQIWQQALELPECPGMDDSFFDLGGDSLAGARLISGVEAGLAVDIDPEEFFRDPTPRALLNHLGLGRSRGNGKPAYGNAVRTGRSPDILRRRRRAGDLADSISRHEGFQVRAGQLPAATHMASEQLLAAIELSEAAQDFRPLRKAADQCLTPLDVGALLDRIETLPKIVQRWLRASPLSRELRDRAPQPYMRTVAHPDVELFSDGKTEERRKSVIVAFCGAANILMIPLPQFLQNLPSEHFDILLLRDRTYSYYENGIGAYASDFPMLIRAIRREFPLSRYGRVYCYGTSMGGLPAIRAGNLLQADRAISVGGIFPSHIYRLLGRTGPELPAFDLLCACVRQSATERIAVYGQESESDRRSAQRLSALCRVTAMPIANVAKHDVIGDLLKAGELPAFFERIFGSDHPLETP